MSAKEHTPGPWTVGEDGRGVWGQVDGVARRLLDVRRTGELARDLLEREANARLAAAAPEMLAACEAALDALQRLDVPEMGRESGKRCERAGALLRSAIAAATGGGR